MFGMVSLESGKFALEFRGTLLEPGPDRVPAPDPLACRAVVAPGLAVVSLGRVTVPARFAHGFAAPCAVG